MKPRLALAWAVIWAFVVAVTTVGVAGLQEIGVREVLLAVGAWCLARGLATWSPAAWYLVPGVLLVWLAIPTRRFPIVWGRAPETKDGSR